MKIQKGHISNQSERYDLEKSPLAQNPTQKDLAHLLGLKKNQIRGIIEHKETYVVRRTELIAGKMRDLVYPKGKYRSIHEKLKYHLNKVRQPEYLYSPRKGKTQRSNADLHIGQRQYLKIDIKQFYPSTTSENVFRWAKYSLGMKDDVAGIFTHIATIDQKVSFGSPLTPVLVSCIYRKMFDSIAMECRFRALKMSIWVDDICISGKFVPGILLDRIRDIIKSHGLRSHKLQYTTGSRSVIITGIAIRGTQLDITRSQHNQISDGYGTIIQSNGAVCANKEIDKQLSRLGRAKYVRGSTSAIGRKTASRMNDLRQRRRSILNRFSEQN